MDHNDDDGLAKGLALADEGMALASDAQEDDVPGWRRRTIEALRQHCIDEDYVDADSFARFHPQVVLHPNAAGSVWQHAINEGWIEEMLGVPRPRSTRPSHHGAKMTPYRSNLWWAR